MIWDIRPLLTLQFWFDVNPPPLLPFFEKAFFFFYLALLVVAVVLGAGEKKAPDHFMRRTIEKARRLCTTFGIVGLLLSFFVYERTPFLSMRFWTLLLWIGMIAWGVAILRWRLRTVPVLQKTIAEKKTREHYLP